MPQHQQPEPGQTLAPRRRLRQLQPQSHQVQQCAREKKSVGQRVARPARPIAAQSQQQGRQPEQQTAQTPDVGGT